MAEPTEHASICDFVIISAIGRGSFGTVYSAFHDEKQYALKYITSGNMKRYGIETPLEIDIMCRLRHNNIMKAEKIITPLTCDIKDLFIVMPLGITSLADAIATMIFTDENKINILYGIASGLAFLHQKHVLSVDLRPANIILFPDDKAVISDFGLSVIADDIVVGKQIMIIATETYNAPELFIDSDGSPRYQYTAMADVWSYGCIIYILLMKSNFVTFRETDR